MRVEVPTMILPKVRDPRFVTIRRAGSLTDMDHRLLALWAAASARGGVSLPSSGGIAEIFAQAFMNSGREFYSGGVHGRGWRTWVSVLCRLGLAAVWLVSGVIKAADPLQTRVAVAAYQLLPDSAAEA